MRFGRPTYFVPICIQHPHGFYGGPAGYQEIRNKAEAIDAAPIVLRTTPPCKAKKAGQK
jgi:hypothetical protein